jgi:hypothetical protein
MKLYATIISERNARPATKGANDYLSVTFTNKGIPIFDVTFKDDGEKRGILEVLSYFDGKTQEIRYGCDGIHASVHDIVTCTDCGKLLDTL